MQCSCTVLYVCLDRLLAIVSKTREEELERNNGAEAASQVVGIDIPITRSLSQCNNTVNKTELIQFGVVSTLHLSVLRKAHGNCSIAI